jgi:hypothetical protein
VDQPGGEGSLSAMGIVANTRDFIVNDVKDFASQAQPAYKFM